MALYDHSVEMARLDAEIAELQTIMLAEEKIRREAGIWLCNRRLSLGHIAEAAMSERRERAAVTKRRGPRLPDAPPRREPQKAGRHTRPGTVKRSKAVIPQVDDDFVY